MQDRSCNNNCLSKMPCVLLIKLPHSSFSTEDKLGEKEK
uniref:Uncharacterized protein n=1 Tax=Anguilla anguilla TaxID=7936 RepID=A0A0E9SE74_ANGAN